MGYHQGKIFGDTSLFSSLELRPKGRYALPVNTGCIYGWPVRTTRTYGPYIWAICMGVKNVPVWALFMGSAYRA